MNKQEQKRFLKDLTVIVDTREKENKHILDHFDKYGIPYIREKLDFCDYSFISGKKDFRQSCVVERKAKVDELYGNIMQDRERLEKELTTATDIADNVTLIIERCADEKALRNTTLTDREVYSQPHRKVMDIGEFVYNTLRAWQPRMKFCIRYVADKENTAAEILEVFYWYYHNYHKRTAPLRYRK